MKWAQSHHEVFITIDIIDVTKTDINLSDEGKLTFRASTRDIDYGFDMELFTNVVKENSGWNIKGRNVTFKLAKKDDDCEEYWPRLHKEKVKNNKIAIDWSKWVDEDAEPEAPQQE